MFGELNNDWAVDRYTCAGIGCATFVVFGTSPVHHSRDTKDQAELRLCTACWERRRGKTNGDG